MWDSAEPVVRRAPKDASNLAAVIRTYMDARGITTNGDMAKVLGVDRTLVSKYINGSRQCHDVTQLRRFAKAMDLPPETFGLLPEPRNAFADGTPTSEAASRWRLVRQTLNRNRTLLTKLAADLYWDPVRIEGTPCITLPEWMPPRPVELASIDLTWQDFTPPPEVNGKEPQGAPYRGAGPTDQPYARYSQAIRGIAKPSLFENRASYRLLDLEWEGTHGHMSFGYTTYFDMEGYSRWLIKWTPGAPK